MKKDRKKLLKYFQQMKGLEELARDYYINVSRDPLLKDQEIKDVFEKISGEEQKHADIMLKIINLINNNI